MARARGFLRKACGCFEAQTEIWTARGLVPIEEIQEGDLVIASDETTGQMGLRHVKATFSRFGAPIVAVTMLIGGVQSETFNTTEEHPFYVPGRGWVEAQSLTPGDVVETLTSGVDHGAADGPAGALAEVALVEFTSRRATVYNFEVEGVHTYRVGASGVLVHNQDSPCNLAGFDSVWKKHGSDKAHMLMMKAKNTPNGPFQGVFDATPTDVQELLVLRLEVGKQFNGAIPIPSGMARVFTPGTGAEKTAGFVKVIWDGKKIQHMYPIP